MGQNVEFSCFLPHSIFGSIVCVILLIAVMNIKMIFKWLVVSTTLILVSFCAVAVPSRAKTGAHVTGHVSCNGRMLSFVTITVRGTTIGTATDGQGYYRLPDLPLGEQTIVANSIGYRIATKQVTTKPNESVVLDFELEEDLLNVDAVVVTGDKDAISRREASTIVNSVTPKLMVQNNARSISEGLPYIPGVRMENNCQNCGFNQVRLNGMEGEYTQTLVDGHPIFSGLMGVYGLEFIPANMIERIEVQRGGGSALYGSNAVAGTVNLILQDPMVNTFQAGFNTDFIGVGIRGTGGVKPDYSASFNSSNVTDNNKAGIAVYGNVRYRTPFDLNNDGYSELPRLKNATVGTRLFHRIGDRGKLSLSYFHITEERRGGNRFDRPYHEANVAEAPHHNVNVPSLVYTQMLRESDLLTLNASFQHVDRESYYGGKANGKDAHPLKDYGLTTDLSYNFGAQYAAHFTQSTLIGGLDFTGERLKDIKPGYTDYSTAPILKDKNGNDSLAVDKANEIGSLTVANQITTTVGAFAQYSHHIGWATLTGGFRIDRYSVEDLASKTGFHNTGIVPVPRVSILLSPIPELQLRANYSMGYRKPQMYNEELHVEVAGAKQIVQRVASDLRRETSHSAMLSADYNRQFHHLALGVLAEGFYTRLKDAFINKRHNADEEGTVLLERMNFADGATIYGLNLEVNVAPSRDLAFKLGGTFQKSQYAKDVPEDLNSGRRDFLRTPSLYGFLLGDWKIGAGFKLNASFNLTGPMDVVYEGKKARNEEERKEIEENDFSIRRTPSFFDLGAKLSYTFNVFGVDLTLYTGVRNVLNSFQKDFEVGAERASSYVYGPMLPRTVYCGLTMGNIF